MKDDTDRNREQLPEAGRSPHAEPSAAAAEERLRALSRRLLAVQEEERRRIARDLHDEVGQMLTGLHLTLEQAAAQESPATRPLLDRARALVQELAAHVRDLTLRLRPPLLDEGGLPAALGGHIERYTAQTGVQVAFAAEGLNRRFPPEVETAAFRIVQEALTNVGRHAGVNRAAVRLRCTGAQLVVEVEDAGAGFDVAAALTAANTSGLSGMRERAELLGGSWQVDSQPGAGTRLWAAFPIDPGPE